MWDDVLAVGLGEDEVDIGSLIYLLYFHRHYLLRVLLTLGGGTPSSWESTRDCMDFPMYKHLMPLIFP